MSCGGGGGVWSVVECWYDDIFPNDEYDGSSWFGERKLGLFFVFLSLDAAEKAKSEGKCSHYCEGSN